MLPVSDSEIFEFVFLDASKVRLEREVGVGSISAG
jgi:hypothetical protein